MAHQQATQLCTLPAIASNRPPPLQIYSTTAANPKASQASPGPNQRLQDLQNLLHVFIHRMANLQFVRHNLIQEQVEERLGLFIAC